MSIDNRRISVLKEDYLKRLIEPYSVHTDEAVII